MHLPEPHTLILFEGIRSLPRMVLVKLVKLLTVRSVGGRSDRHQRSKINTADQSPMPTHTNHRLSNRYTFPSGSEHSVAHDDRASTSERIIRGIIRYPGVSENVLSPRYHALDNLEPHKIQSTPLRQQPRPKHATQTC